MRTFLLGLGLALTAAPGMADPVAVSQRPAARAEAAVTEAERAAQAGLEAWVVQFRPRALAAGIRPATFSAAFRDLRYDADAVARDRNQAEFNRTLWDYLDSAVSEARIAGGRAALAQHGVLLGRIEARYGVPKEIVVAVWGMETSYGTRRGDHPLVGALATLAHDGRRARFFEEQLIAALKILDKGDVRPEAMTGSWAGAMGHTQFMPTSYLDFAVDFTGDGRRDIWSDDPSDALASTAAYLAQSGWRSGEPWGVEVRLPAGFDFSRSGKSLRQPPARWEALGVRRVGGSPLPAGEAALLLPAGAQGAAFLIYPNFRAIARYNPADAYVIGVGHLADRLKGAPAIAGGWPRGDRALALAERTELQHLLTAAGFDTGGADGMIGPNTLSALRAWQAARGLVADGYANEAVLNRLREGA
ncbi:lytic murein transglycosylase [Cereibacter johrii]|uniref:Membrane-bound lytic murein transglycosylase B n=1 Tax=Cereibacter johrii TaxID=445629 RepID=A0ABX5JC05_9RHOB|nr:lytic murein transglycosylase [Cereibacter johrii]ODM41170.1 murein transglycosylase [Cereibacter johrii]PTM79603.1 membrane-bound lytic murein transglycosylase B [Cereibacter johrii]